MTYKTILTYYDGYTDSPRRFSKAVEVAKYFDAHLQVLALGYEVNIPPYAFGAPGVAVAEIADRSRAESENLAAVVDEAIARAGVLGEAIAKTCTYGELDKAIGNHARYSDLVVIGEPYAETEYTMQEDALEGALFDGDAAVLVCPLDVAFSAFETVLVAWDGSREALRAIRRAMPILKQASAVEVTMLDPPSIDSAPGSEMATLLSRHEVDVEIYTQSTLNLGTAEALKRRVAENGANLVVMGAYGHSPFREYVLGGVTREVLHDVPVPIFMTH